MKAPARTPRATYRVQLHAGFAFAELGEIVPYLADLGISDVYASPLFKAAPGSLHGYDVCDHNEINPELGGAEGLARLGSILREHGLGLIVDFVPNHMGIEGRGNSRWLDVLENGSESRYADYFDINWHPRQALQSEGVLVPMLHDFYGRVLEAGELKLVFEEAKFWVAHGPLRFPLRPASSAIILERLAWFKQPGTPVALLLEALAERFRRLADVAPRHEVTAAPLVNEAPLLAAEFQTLLATHRLEPDLDRVLLGLNGTVGQATSFDQLHRILEDQHYRLAYWKSGTHEINYRRFFAIDTLVALRVERAEVFDDIHRLLKFLIERGDISGVRVDHIDGLWDPVQYLDRLSALGGRQDDPLYLLVEKILTGDEQLPREWAVHGTTGYEFAGNLIDLLVPAENEAAFTRIYQEATGVKENPEDFAYRLKRFIVDELFSTAVETLVLDLATLIKLDRRWRDLTVNELRLALARLIACLPVYRTYVRVGQEKPSLADATVITSAVAEALRRNPSIDPTSLHFIANVWLGLYPGPLATAEQQGWADRWICKLQQFTGAITAKSIEDTFFYRFVRLFAANEVGHQPALFGRPPLRFHEINQERFQHLPANLLATSTHDTKVSEDVRARLIALAAFPERWGELLGKWADSNRPFKTQVGAQLAPDRNEEYMLYQFLLGAWPAEGSIDDSFRERIRQTMRKALSESKANTNWSNPNESWLNASDAFVAALLDEQRAGDFWREFIPFAQVIARRGADLSLVQTVLKLTCPGVPDLYQGTELWDFSLVDPDNRRPVDYNRRRELLAFARDASLEKLLAQWSSGAIKLRVIERLLRYRAGHPKLFTLGAYVPLTLTGPGADDYLAFLRDAGSEALLVAVRIRWPEETARAAMLEMPTAASARWRELISGREISHLDLNQLLADLPVAVLAAEL